MRTPPENPCDPVRALTHLGPMPCANFWRGHWQRAPLLIPQALPGFESPLTGPSALFELSGRTKSSRAWIDRVDGRWRLRHGPFRRAASRPERFRLDAAGQGIDVQSRPAPT